MDAARDAGLRVGLYLSLPDWHDPDYPAWTDEMRPYGYAFPTPEPEAWSRFSARLQAQLRHLLTAYGRIDTLWFDGGWEHSAKRWGSGELERIIRELQPDIVVNDRLPEVGDYGPGAVGAPPRPGGSVGDVHDHEPELGPGGGRPGSQVGPVPVDRARRGRRRRRQPVPQRVAGGRRRRPRLAA